MLENSSLRNLSFLDKYSRINGNIIRHLSSIIETHFTILGFFWFFIWSIFFIADLTIFIGQKFPGWIPGWDLWLAIVLIITLWIFTWWSLFCIYFVFRYIVMTPIKVLFTKITKEIIAFHRYIRDSIQSEQNIGEVLEKLGYIFRLHKRLIILKTITKKIHKVDSIELSNTIDESIEWILWVIHDLQSDMMKDITEQKNILESTKSEVTKNIQWTTELNKVSEVQRARLDNQIEQFEELQGVLVKV